MGKGNTFEPEKAKCVKILQLLQFMVIVMLGKADISVQHLKKSHQFKSMLVEVKTTGLVYS